MTELFGYVGGIFLAICSLPQAIMAVKEGNSNGISYGFLILWSLGEIFTLLYILPKADIPLLLNYTSNILFLSVIWKYKLFPRK